MSQDNKEYLTLSKDIKYLINELNKLYEMEYNQIKPTVNYIIKNSIRNEKLIEQILERLLNIPTEKCYELFKQLCFYTAIFNSSLSNDYLTLYDELYGKDEENVLIKK